MDQTDREPVSALIDRADRDQHHRTRPLTGTQANAVVGFLALAIVIAGFACVAIFRFIAFLAGADTL